MSQFNRRVIILAQLSILALLFISPRFIRLTPPVAIRESDATVSRLPATISSNSTSLLVPTRTATLTNTPSASRTPTPFETPALPTFTAIPTVKLTAIPTPPSITPKSTPSEWILNPNNTDCIEVNGQNVLRIWANKYWEGIHVRRRDFTVPSGGNVSFRFRLADVNHAGRFALLPQGKGFIGLIFHEGRIYPDYNVGVKDIGLASVATVQQIDLWYLAQMSVDLSGTITWRLWREDNPDNHTILIDFVLDDPTTRAFFQSKAFQFYLHAGARPESGISTLYFANYQEGTDNSTQQVPVCPLLR